MAIEEGLLLEKDLFRHLQKSGIALLAPTALVPPALVISYTWMISRTDRAL